MASDRHRAADGFTRVAEDSPAALLLWAQHGPDVDLLFTDMVMPNGMTGMQLGVSLRQTKPGLKIVLMSGYSSEIIKGRSQWGANVAFLAKPFEAEVMAATIRQCLDGADADEHA